MKVEEYNLAERAAIEGRGLLSEIFRPVVFEHVNFPTRVRGDEDLHRYVDAMHEGRGAGIVGKLGGFNDQEKMFCEQIIAAARDEFGITPVDALASAVNVFREINKIGGAVFEIGPGSGYLGALLVLSGRPYVGMENTQAFYLTQNRIWSRLGKVVDCALDPISHPESGTFVHLPWWKVEEWTHPVRVVTANHCLCEIEPRALDLLMGKLAEALKPSGTLMFEGWGLDSYYTQDSVMACLARHGFRKEREDAFITVFRL